jgi:transcriptional regulator with XRE-family HTH domain
MQTGMQIREARASLGRSAQQLAKRAHVPEATVKRAERSAGEPAITLEHLRKIRAALEAAGGSVHPPKPVVSLNSQPHARRARRR